MLGIYVGSGTQFRFRFTFFFFFFLLCLILSWIEWNYNFPFDRFVALIWCYCFFFPSCSLLLGNSCLIEFWVKLRSCLVLSLLALLYYVFTLLYYGAWKEIQHYLHIICALFKIAMGCMKSFWSEFMNPQCAHFVAT